MLSKIFEELGLSVITERVFNELLTKGTLSARQLADNLSIPRPSVYDHLKILIQKDLVAERSEDSKKAFVVADIQNIPNLLKEKIRVLESEKHKFELELPNLLKSQNFIEPQIKFYTGKEGMKQVMNHIMLNRDIETFLFWPMSEMMEVLGPEFLKDLNEKRVKRNISLRAIWDRSKVIDFEKYPYLKASKETLRELRFSPEGMSWEMGYWMYDDKVIFLSSRKEGFGFVVHSRDFANMMRIQFNAIWNISTPANNEGK